MWNIPTIFKNKNSIIGGEKTKDVEQKNRRKEK